MSPEAASSTWTTEPTTKVGGGNRGRHARNGNNLNADSDRTGYELMDTTPGPDVARGAPPLSAALPPRFWQGLSLLRRPVVARLVASNALMSLGAGMQLLLHGWLAVAWGHSLWMLVAFSGSRIIPKLLLTVPAGIICDRVPRARVLKLARAVDVAASLLPLAGFIAPMPLVWLLAASTLAGAVHAFDLPAGRGALADLTEREETHAAVALNSAGHHVAMLLGPALAFGLASWPGRPVPLLASAALLGIAALISPSLSATSRKEAAQPTPRSTAAFVRYLMSTPAVLLLILAGSAPGLLDRGIALVLPSAGAGGAATGLALLAPEAGALLAAVVLAMSPVRLGVAAVIAGTALYASFVTVASQNRHEVEILVLALALGGVARLVVNATAQARLQHLVPAEVRGRVMAV